MTLQERNKRQLGIAFPVLFLLLLLLLCVLFLAMDGVGRRVESDAQKVAATEKCAASPSPYTAGREEKEKPAVAGFLCSPLSFFLRGCRATQRNTFLREEKRECKRNRPPKKKRNKEGFALFTTFLLTVILDREGTKRGPPRMPTKRDRANQRPRRLSQYAARAWHNEGCPDRRDRIHAVRVRRDV